jgi:hypothetical protein
MAEVVSGKLTGKLLGQDYFAILRGNNVAHTFNSWTRMPSVGEQLDFQDPFTTDFAVARLLLRPGRTYESAVSSFQPYKEIRDSYPEGHRDTVNMIRAGKKDLPTRKFYIAANNRYEGNMLGTIAGIVKELQSEVL